VGRTWSRCADGMKCPRCGRLLVGRKFCVVHGSVVDPELGPSPVEEPVPRRRRDLAPRTGSAWTPSELAFVRRQKDTMSIADLARELKRTPKGVMNLLSSRGWRKRRVGSAAAVAIERATAAERAGKRWSTTEDTLLLDLPVHVVLSRRVSLFPGRTVGALRKRRRRLMRVAPRRRADGLMTLLDVAREYRCSRWRVARLVRAGQLPAVKSPWGDWLIEPADCEAIEELLRAPKRTYKGVPPDLGDYRERYGA